MSTSNEAVLANHPVYCDEEDGGIGWLAVGQSYNNVCPEDGANDLQPNTISDLTDQFLIDITGFDSFPSTISLGQDESSFNAIHCFGSFPIVGGQTFPTNTLSDCVGEIELSHE